MSDFLTTRQVGEILGVDEWQVRRLFESGDLPDPPRFAGKRLIARQTIPLILDALRVRGWLAESEVGHGE